MHVGAALRSKAAAVPSSLSLGTGSTAQATLRIENLTADGEIYSISVEPRDGGAAPVPSVSSLEVAGGQGGELTLTFDGAGLPSGKYEGIVRVTGALGGAELRVPYWYGVPGKTPAAIPLIEVSDAARRGRELNGAIRFRVTDSSGIPIDGVSPEVTVVEGGGSVERVDSGDSNYPGLFSASVRLGPLAGVNTFRIQAGDLRLDVNITGQ